MSKKIVLSSLIIWIAMTTSSAQYKTLYDFKVSTIEGEDYDLSQLRGKKVLIVNTASKCGFTPQYEGLQELYKKYGDGDFVIIGFPANNFMRQEPGSNEEIKEFCTINYGVTFPMMAKISVKGKDMHPLYHWLTQKELNGFKDSSVKWNFQKYMVDEKGKLVGILPPKTKPLSEEIVNWVTEE
ncbi:MAG: glutathione peroxidase [Bacteroides sp. SM23_62]|nr:MAG: glutathione peroxidase [Bacteroides sp. SM23_62]